MCADYFSHRSPEKQRLNIAKGEIRLPLIAMERS
ncbi:MULTISPECIES: hypothetical protein [Pseudomonas]